MGTGLYYGGERDNFFDKIDEVGMYNVSEPSTLSFLILNSLILLRRRRA
jgi:hypothetical protein